MGEVVESLNHIRTVRWFHNQPFATSTKGYPRVTNNSLMREKPSTLEFRGQEGQSGLNLASLDQVFSDLSKFRRFISFSFCESLFTAVSYLLLCLQLQLDRVVVMTTDAQNLQAPQRWRSVCSYNWRSDSPLACYMTLWLEAAPHLLCALVFSFIKQITGLNKVMCLERLAACLAYVLLEAVAVHCGCRHH